MDDDVGIGDSYAFSGMCGVHMFGTPKFFQESLGLQAALHVSEEYSYPASG